MGLKGDDGDYLSSLVPVDRGKQWSIHDCFYGNEEKGREKITEMVNYIDKLEKEYDVDLKTTIIKLEGLVSGISSHASGIYIFKNGYIEQNSKMKTPRGDDITAWSMEDSDYCGGLKYDLIKVALYSNVYRKVM